MKVKHSNSTVACRIGDTIYLHPDLIKFPELYKAILRHEKQHTDTFSWKDIKLDLENTDLKPHKKIFYKFILKHPKTILGFMPITKIDGNWVLDPSMIAVTIFALGIFILLVRLL